MHPVRYILSAIVLIFFGVSTSWLLSKIRFKDPEPGKKVQVFDNVDAPETIQYRGNNAVGKALYQNNCASCHNPFKQVTGPPLFGFVEKEPWASRANVYQFINKPQVFRRKSSYIRKLEMKYEGMKHIAFPLTPEEIDAIISYIDME